MREYLYYSLSEMNKDTNTKNGDANILNFAQTSNNNTNFSEIVLIIERHQHLGNNCCAAGLTPFPLCFGRCTTGSGNLNAFTE